MTMRQTFLILLTCSLLFVASGLRVLTAAETLTVSFKTSAAGGQFAPENIVAVWIETAGGSFVKTIGDWSKGRRANLTAWRAKAGTTDTDAIIGPTRTSHATTLTVSWDMLPRGGTAAVADGTYVVRFETVDENGGTKANRTGVSFIKNGSASTVGPLSQNGYSSISLTYTGRTPTTAPVVTSATSAAGFVGVAFAYTIVASGSPTIFSAIGLPSGLTVNPSTGVISGTPTAGGTTSVTIGATNGIGTGTATLSLTMVPAPVVTSSTSASGTVGATFAYTISGSNNPTSFAATGLPAGLSVNSSTGVITGSPSAAATSSVTIKATNAAGTGQATLTLVVSAPVAGAPVITSGNSISGYQGVALTYTIVATNGPTNYSATGLPAGVTVNTGTGVISGTPTSNGTSSATISATNASGTGSSSLQFVILGVPVITSMTTGTATEGSSYNYQVTASNNPTSFSATGLPSGLSISTTTGMISGIPTSPGNATITLHAVNPAGTGTAILTLTIDPAPVASPNGTPASSGAVKSCGYGSGYAFVLTALMLALAGGRMVSPPRSRR